MSCGKLMLAAAGGAMPDPTFDLTNNPFYQLGVSARDGLDRITDAAEEAETRGRLSAQAARDARRQLATSRPRLDAELRWLPGVHPDAVNLIVKALCDQRLARAHEVLPQLPGLARANVASHLCCSDQDANPPLRHLFEAQSLILTDDIEQRVNGERSTAGLPLVTREHVAAGLDEVIDLHARAAVRALLRGSGGADALVTIVQDSQEGRGRARVLLERTVERFDSEAAARIQASEEQIDAAAQILLAHPEDTKALETVKAGIALWASLTKPRRLMSTRIGVDDQRTSAFVKRQRDVCLSLVDEHDAHAVALDIARALAAQFADQKRWGATLVNDVRALEENVANEQNRALLDPLENALKAARRKIHETIASLDWAGFDTGSTGPVHGVYFAFVAAVGAGQPRSPGDAPWLMVRSLAIDINNEQHRPGAALNLIEGLLRHRPPAPRQILDKLHQDRAALAREAGLLRAEAAISSRRLSEARAIVLRLIEDERDQGERNKLRDLVRGIEAREAANSRRWKVGAGWTVAGIGLLIWLLSRAGGSPPSPTYQPAATYAPPSNTYTPPPLSRPPPSTAVGAEVMPPVQTGQHLNRDQIRWCEFQSERLDGVQVGLVFDDQIRRYNQLVDDWNQRCARYTYRPGDREAVIAERASQATRLREEGSRLIPYSAPAMPNVGSASPNTAPRPQPQPPSPTGRSGPIESGQRILSMTQSDDVRLIQDRLRELGWFAGQSTGNFGPVTQSALREWRRQNFYSDAVPWSLAMQRDLFRGTGR